MEINIRCYNCEKEIKQEDFKLSTKFNDTLDIFVDHCSCIKSNIIIKCSNCGKELEISHKDKLEFEIEKCDCEN